MSNVVRAFVAVEIPGEVRERAAQLIKALRSTPAKVRWVEPRNMHWTLKFLGDVDLRETPAICAAVAGAVHEFAPFDVEACGAGAFPAADRPRTVWIGMGRGSEQMIALHNAIDQALGKLGYREEGRKFRPHLTIGRVRSSPSGIGDLAELLQQHADFASGLSTVYEVVVFSSDLDEDGPTYEPLGHAEFKGKSDDEE